MKRLLEFFLLTFLAFVWTLPASADEPRSKLNKMAQETGFTASEALTATMSRGLILNVATESVLTGQEILSAMTPAVSTVALTADDQAVSITATGSSSAHPTIILLNSDNATAGNRTFTLSGTPTAGQVLILVGGTNASELADSGTTRLSAAWTVGAGDTLSLVYVDSNWNETGRSNN